MNSRRNFIRNTGTTIAGLSLLEMFPLELLASIRKKVSPNDKINIGLIGVRGQGFSDLKSLLKMSEVNLIGICDIDDNELTKRKNDLSKLNIANPVIYNDYRKMLENKDIDAVIIATPDHWHCLQLTDALSAGKHVYCEKPLGNSIAEVQVMLKAAERSGKAVQVNQWQRSEKHFKDAVAYVQSGKLGTIINTKTWMHNSSGILPVMPDAPVPAGVDYNRWLGPAKNRPFNVNRFHYEFRWFWDYAGGLMTDWGVHLIDIVLWAMNVNEPSSVSAVGGKRLFPNDARETPDYQSVVYDFGSFTNTWDHYIGISNGQYGRSHGIAFIGTNATLVVNRGGWEVIPEKDKDKPRIEAVPLNKLSDVGMDLHAQNFIEVLKSGKLDQLACPIQTAAKVAINAHMGNLAYRTGEKIYWDATKNKFNSEKANALIKPTYHNGFVFPKI